MWKIVQAKSKHAMKQVSSAGMSTGKLKQRDENEKASMKVLPPLLAVAPLLAQEDDMRCKTWNPNDNSIALDVYHLSPH